VKLKKLLAEAMLDNAMLKEIAKKMVTPAAKREAVGRRLCEAERVQAGVVRA
jgi:hypothetical protein